MAAATEPSAIPTMDAVDSCAELGVCVAEVDGPAGPVIEVESADVGAGFGVLTMVLVTT